MVKLFCAIVGVAGSAFSVRVDESDSVDDLKKAIKVEKPNDFKDVDADKLQLFLAKTADGKWLDGAGLAGVTLDEAGAPVSRDENGTPQGFKKMDPLLWINNDKHFGKNFGPVEGDVHVLVVVPEGAVGSASETSRMDQVVQEVHEIHAQTVLGKRKVYRHSSASSTLLTELNVQFKSIDTAHNPTGDMTRVEPFSWGSIIDEHGQDIALTEEQQRERYRAYVEVNIGDALTRNKLCVRGVERGKDILKADIPGRNIGLAGGTDMIILSDFVLARPLDLMTLPGVRLLIEVKRKVEERSIFQALSELIALDVLVDQHVMALLTDLTNHWQFFWVSDKVNNHGTILSVTFRDPSEAFAVIRALLDQPPSADAEISLPFFQGPVKRQKLTRVLASIGEASGSGGIVECLERYNDIASILGPDVEMAREVARQITRSIPTLTYFS